MKRNTVPQIDPLLLTEKQAVKRLNISVSTLRRWRQKYAIPIIKVGGHPALFSRRLGLFRYGSPQQRGGGVMARTDGLYRRRNYYYFKYKST